MKIEKKLVTLYINMRMPILLMLTALMMVSILGCIGEPNENTTTLATPPISTEISVPNETLAESETVKCELCHINPENIRQHVNGGEFCINCHGSQVHNIHMGEGTVNLGCDACHGFPPKVPTLEKGTGPGHYIICENCHAPPPNSLNSSLGNLVIIHLSRNKYCTNCHGIELGKIHEAALNQSR